MADVLTREQRKNNMSRICGKNTKPEEMVRKYLFSRGLRYRKNDKKLPGKPDIVLPKYRTIVFVHGCFWHMHEGCRYFVLPSTNTEFWKNKLEGNRERDRKVQNELKDAGWRVLIVWECELKMDRRDETLTNLYNEITCQQNHFLDLVFQ